MSTTFPRAQQNRWTCHKCLKDLKEGEVLLFYDHGTPQLWHKECYDPEVDFWAHVMN